MKLMKRIAALLTTACMMSLPMEEELPAAAVTAGYTDGGTVSIRIDQREVDIKDIGEPVPIYVRMDAVEQGISAMEYGITVDERCTYSVVIDSDAAEELGGENLNIEMTVGDSSDPSFKWLTWAAATPKTRALREILYMVNIPSTAQIGDVYEIKYEVTSVASPELLRNDTDMIEYTGAATDGWIKIVGEEPTELPTAPPTDSVASGKCGDNLTWTLEDGTLTISGTGAMTDYGTIAEHSPWYDNRDNITSAIIEDGVTSIGASAFFGCYNMTAVTISASVTSIENYAFGNCKGLVSAIIPDNVTSIGNNAFNNCSYLTSVTILNPKCKIGDSSNTICNLMSMSATGSYYTGEIRGYNGSTAQAYAEKYGYTFASLDPEPTDPPTEAPTEKVTEPTHHLYETVIAGKYQSVTINDIMSCSSADTTIATVSVMGDDQLLVYGKTTGTTEITVHCSSGAVYIVHVTVTEEPTTEAFAPTPQHLYETLYVGSFKGYEMTATPVSIDFSDPAVASVSSDTATFLYVKAVKTGTCDITFTLANGEVYILHLTVIPLEAPTEPPTDPTEPPTEAPTEKPTEVPTEKPTESPTEQPTNPPKGFTMTRDNWSFPNNKDNFSGGSYYISEADMALLLRGLTTAEQDYMRKQCTSEWKGSCYGMACTALLAWNGLIDPTEFGAANVYDISGPPRGEALSLINCYQLSQKLPTKRLEAANELKKSESEKLSHLLEECATGKPVLLTFQSLGVAHAMVAYSIDYGRWTVDDKTFSARILTYDPNKASFNEDSCLYYDATSGNWVIPEYGASTYVTVKKSKLGICTADPENFILQTDSETPKKPTAVDAYKVILEYEGAMPVPEIRELTYSDGTWNDADDDNDMLEFSDVYGDVTLQLRAFKKADAAYRLTAPSAPQEMRASIFYDSNMLTAQSSSATLLELFPEQILKMRGKGMAYTASIILNDTDDYVTDWHTLTVTGANVDEVRLEKTDKGYVLWASNLKDVSVTAQNDKDKVFLNFSSGLQKVLLFQDGATLAAAVDKDGDGSFETILARSEENVTELALGDVNGDSAINATDAAQVLIAAANIGAGKDSGLTEAQKAAADVNKDGSVNATDAAIILQYAAAVGAGQKDVKITDFVH